MPVLRFVLFVCLVGWFGCYCFVIVVVFVGGEVLGLFDFILMCAKVFAFMTPKPVLMRILCTQWQPKNIVITFVKRKVQGF